MNYPGTFKTKLQVVYGPGSEEAARSTAAALGCGYSVFSVYRKDEDGCVVEDESDYYVEYNPNTISDRIFGYDANEFISRQYKRNR